MSSVSSSILGTLLLVALLTSQAIAMPYFYFVDPEPQSQQVVKAAEANAQQQQQPGELPQRLQGHLNQLLSHGNSAMHSIVESIQPDIKNLGRDLTDVMHATRENVGKRIEPLANTAQKSMGPLIDQAREDIPKALTKVGEQVKGVWEKMTSGAQQPGVLGYTSGSPLTTANMAQEAQKLGGQIQQAAQQAVQTVQQNMNNKSS